MQKFFNLLNNLEIIWVEKHDGTIMWKELVSKNENKVHVMGDVGIRLQTKTPWEHQHFQEHF